jgi:hypothetical protein
MEYPSTENPFTGSIINLYSDEVNQLLSRGVTEQEILNLRRTPTYYNRESVFDDVVLYNIMLNSDIKTIKNLCMNNKNVNLICKDKNFWEAKLDKEGFSFVLDKTMKSYENMLKFQKEAKNLMMHRNIDVDYSVNTDLSIILPERIENEVNIAIKDIDMDTIDSQEMSIFIYKNTIRFDWNLYDQNGDENDILSLYISKNELYNIFIKTMYYYPDIEFSYRN